jgi:hypothetical protein
MKANELADEAMEHYNAEKQKGFNVNWMQEVSTMLRHQADYIKHLEDGLESSLNLNKAQAERHGNNEPVAWMEYIQDEEWEVWFVEPTDLPKGHTYKPLYTHPANIITEIIEKNKPEIEKANAYIKSLEDEIKALKAKTLTDEEIWAIWHLSDKEIDTWAVNETVVNFARLLLKKAQEK